MKTLRVVPFPDRDRWLEARAGVLGSSDVPAAFGLSFADKPKGDSVRLRFGKSAEPWLLAEAAARLENRGLTVSPFSQSMMVLGPESTESLQPSATLDATLHSATTGELCGVLEAKTTTLTEFATQAWWVKWDPQGARPSIYAWLQVQHQMWVTSLPLGVVICGFGAGERISMWEVAPVLPESWARVVARAISVKLGAEPPRVNLDALEEQALETSFRLKGLGRKDGLKLDPAARGGGQFHEDHETQVEENP